MIPHPAEPPFRNDARFEDRVGLTAHCLAQRLEAQAEDSNHVLSRARGYPSTCTSMSESADETAQPRRPTRQHKTGMELVRNGTTETCARGQRFYYASPANVDLHGTRTRAALTD